jgi:malate/lactate dehydrogenase
MVFFSIFLRTQVRVLVVGNPANTNCGIAMACAPKVRFYGVFEPF